MPPSVIVAPPELAPPASVVSCPLPDPPLSEDAMADDALDKAEARLLLPPKVNAEVAVPVESSPVLVKPAVSESSDGREVVEEGVGVMAVSPTSEQQPFPGQTTG